MHEDQKSVLIVDDEAMICDAVAFELDLKGYKTFKANSGNEAWQVFQKETPDIVVTDVRMPNGDGVELLDRIRQEHPGFPVILFITGYKDISDEDAIKKGVNGIIQKPFTGKVLMGELQKHLS